MHSVLQSLAPGAFLADYWQKHALFIPGALERICPALTADELGWLATLSDVEARLVYTVHDGGRTTYRVENGPFAVAELESLPEENWTLLVHDVDKHLPDFRQLFAHTDFVPDWRIDDLMVSCAAPGGSVGPHRDNYDVFLCQGKGRRAWSLGDPRSAQPDHTTASLSLLKPFAVTEKFVASEGDVLYLPPGVPHWGVAEEFCMTYSIGMRAPGKKELAAGAARVLAVATDDLDSNAGSAGPVFYRDPDLAPGEADAGQISLATLDRVRQQELLDASLSDQQVARVFGSVVTEPKAWLAPERGSAQDAAGFLAQPEDLLVHGMSQLAWCESADFRLAFANGSACDTSAAGIALMRELCSNRAVSADKLATIHATEAGEYLLEWLSLQGVFDVAAGPQ